MNELSVEITKYVKIATTSLTEPLELTTVAAIELRDALIEAFPLSSSSVSSRSLPEKWVLSGKTWRKGTRPVSVKAVKKVINHVGKEWMLIDKICDVTGYCSNTIRDAVGVLVQEQKMDSRGRGKTRAMRIKTIEYVPTHPEVPMIEVVNENINLTALEKEQKLKRDHMRNG